MYDADTLEAINVEQLATATDRLLLRGRVAKRRPSTAGRDPYPRMVSHGPAPRAHRAHPAPPTFARGSQPQLAAPRLDLACREHARPTILIRTPSSARTQVFAVTVVIPTLVGIMVGLAALL